MDSCCRRSSSMRQCDRPGETTAGLPERDLHCASGEADMGAGGGALRSSLATPPDAPTLVHTTAGQVLAHSPARRAV